MEPSPRFFQRLALGALLLSLAVIVWGAFVRATGSGAGCGDHWPLCNAQLVPRAPTTQTMIEFAHRASSGLALLVVVLLVGAAFRAHPKGHSVRRLAVTCLVLMLVEAALGAFLVKRELVANNASASRAVAMSIHLLNTFLLLAAQAACVWASRTGDSLPALSRAGVVGVTWVGSLLTVGAVGVSGAVAALGDTLVQQGIHSAVVDLLVRLRIVHPTLALVATAVTVGLAVVASAQPTVRPGALVLGVLLAVQLAAGLINVILQAPVGMQLLHLLLADCVWVAVVLVGLTASHSTAGVEAVVAPVCGPQLK
jgi:heme a synthase